MPHEERLVGERGLANRCEFASKADKLRVKRGHEIGEPRRSVALRINIDKQRLHRGRGRPDCIERQRDRLQFGRTHVRTGRVAGIDDQQLAAIIRVAALLARMVDELERTADRIAPRQQQLDQFGRRGFGLRGERQRQENAGQRNAQQKAPARPPRACLPGAFDDATLTLHP